MITDADIRRAVPQMAFDTGLQMHLQGQVEEVEASAGGRVLEAYVQGSRRTAYRQTIQLTPGRDGKLSITGVCDCPVRLSCKHIAAALFAYQEEVRHVGDRSAPHVSSSVGHTSRLSPEFRASPGLPTATWHAQAIAPLPYDIDTWLRGLAAAQEIETEDYPSSVRKRLLYVLERRSHSGGLTVSPRSVELKRDGGGLLNGPAKPHTPDQLMRGGQQPKFLRPSDRAILRRLSSFGAEGTEDFIATLQAIIATGRGRWAAWDGPSLQQGEPVPGELAWVLDDDGRQHPELVVIQTLLALRLAVPWYVDPATGVMGPVETALSPRLLRAMLASPPLPSDVAGRVREEMRRRLPGVALPTPKPVAPPQVLREPLQPQLRLLSGELSFDTSAKMAGYRYGPIPTPTESHRLGLARLSWRYGPITIPFDASLQPDRTVQQDGQLFLVVRDRQAEQRAADRARKLGLDSVAHHHYLPSSHPHANDLMLMDADPAAWVEFMLADVPRLHAEGWQVDVADDFPLRLAEPSGPISFELHERSGIDWFDLDLGVMVDGKRISLVPALLDLIATVGLGTATSVLEPSDDQGPPLLLPLPDGRLLTVPMAQLQPILAPLLELFAGAEVDEQAGTLRLTRRNAGDLALLEVASAATGLAWAGGEAVRSLGRQLRQHGGIPACPVPALFQATLRPYQEQGLAWLQFLAGAGLGGVLADDMGLGKTVQTLAHLVVEQQAGRLVTPALVICPTSLVPNWQAEAARFAPSLRTLVLHGPDRADSFARIGRQNLVVTTYPLLARDHAVLIAQDWRVVILDEAQTIKNPLAATSKLARTLRAGQRLCLSGTPLENHLGELWSLFDFLAPGLLGDRQQFGRHYRTPIEKAGDIGRQASLARRVAPFLLRRTKAQVAADLPPKTDIAETVAMGEAQSALYEGIRLAMHAKVRAAVARRGMAGSGIIILDALLKLRQACCDPRLLKLATAKATKAKSAKLERLLELLPPMLEEGRRVLLFSQFTSMLALIEAELDRLALPYVLLTGDTKDRTVPVRRFQAGEVPLFLISLKAGGVGLNLTAADTVIHYDPWWNPAVEDQATDRAHRIGQDKPVFVHRLITAGTIEEKMEGLKQRKQALAAGILGASTGKTLTLTEGDLDVLFAPPEAAPF